MNLTDLRSITATHVLLTKFAAGHRIGKAPAYPIVINPVAQSTLHHDGEERGVVQRIPWSVLMAATSSQSFNSVMGLVRRR